MSQCSLSRTVSVILCAFNEQNNIRQAVEGVMGAIQNEIDDFELLVVNDGSTDKTPDIIDDLAKKYPQVRVFHNNKNYGYGYSFRRALKEARMDYVSVFPGDNDICPSTMTNLVRELGKADIILSYLKGHQNRSWARKVLSRFFVILLNLIFGLNMKYFNGSFLYETQVLKMFPLRSDGLTILPECSLRFLASGCSYIEVPMKHTGGSREKSTAVSFKNIFGILMIVLRLRWELFCTKGKLPTIDILRKKES